MCRGLPFPVLKKQVPLFFGRHLIVLRRHLLLCRLSPNQPIHLPQFRFVFRSGRRYIAYPFPRREFDIDHRAIAIFSVSCLLKRPQYLLEASSSGEKKSTVVCAAFACAIRRWNAPAQRGPGGGGERECSPANKASIPCICSALFCKSSANAEFRAPNRAGHVDAEKRKGG